LKQFNDNADRKKLVKANGVDIKPLDNNVVGIEGENRQMIKWIYEAKKGEVSEQPFQVGDKFVVPVVLDIFEKGPMSVAKARPLVEHKIRNDKKAEQIIKKIGNATTLDAVAKATVMPTQSADSLRFNNPLINHIATEPKVVGAAFNTNYQSPKISGPIKGESGVFVISVNSIGAIVNPNVDIKQQQVGMQKGQAAMIGYGAIEAMKKNAKIKDYRSRFF
jgi:peptidyl-prolyl cis-trans isomerase D